MTSTTPSAQTPAERRSMPLWVKVLGITGILLLVAFVLLHLTGNGFGGHSP